MWFSSAPIELVPTIVKLFHFLNIMSYCCFQFFMLLARLLLLIFYHTFLCRTPYFCHGFLIWHRFLFWCLLVLFFLSFSSYIASSFLFFPLCFFLSRSSFFSSLISSAFLGIILHEFFLVVPWPNKE